MDIENILKEIAETIGKRKGDLTRSYNAIFKKKVAEGIAEFIPEENLQRLVLIGVSAKYKFAIDDLDKVIANHPAEEEETTEENTIEDLEEELEEVEEDLDIDDSDEVEFEEEDDGEFDDLESLDGDSEIEFEEDDDDYGLETREGTWEDIFESTPEPKEGEGDYERLDSLTIITGTTYYLKLVDASEVPYKHEGIGTLGKNKGKPYTSRAMDVILLKVTPKSRYNERFEKGDNRGKKCFINKKKYKLWMSETAFKWFAKFWRDEVGRKAPDGRIWTFEQLKKENVTKYYFGEYKK